MPTSTPPAPQQPSLDGLRERLDTARAAASAAFAADLIPGLDGNDLTGAAQHLRDVHGWPVHAAEETCPAALKAMHLTACRQAVQDAEDDLGFAAADALDGELIPDAYDRAAADQAGGPYPDEDPAYLAYVQSEMGTCRADFIAGGYGSGEQYGTSCDHGLGHYPHTAHDGDDPFGSTSGRVTWRGGGTIDGDWLPQTDVTFYDRPGD
jgi:hypothetical protein